jgi:hypothetical protein
MRSELFLMVAALLLPWSSSAQVPHIAESGTFQAGSHSWKRVLTNKSSSSLVAYMLGCNPKHGTTALQDALLGMNSYSSVDSGGSVEADVNDPSWDSCAVGVRAAIFSDGSVEGEPESITELYAHRRGADLALEETIKLLTSVYAQHAPLSDVIDILKRRSNGGKTPEENVGYAYALDVVKRVLAEPRAVHGLRIPLTNPGEKQQLPAIDDVMRELGLSHEEADVSLFNMRLETWKSMLENHLEPGSPE